MPQISVAYFHCYNQNKHDINRFNIPEQKLHFSKHFEDMFIDCLLKTIAILL